MKDTKDNKDIVEKPTESDKMDAVFKEVEFPEPLKNGEPLPWNNQQLDTFTIDILKRNILKPVSVFVQGANAATATNYGCFFVADRVYTVVSISESHDVVGSDGAAVTVSVEKCVSGVAPDSGVDLLTTALSLKATARTPQFGTLTTTVANLGLKRGDRLILKDTGTLTDVSDVCVTVIVREL